MGAWAKSVIDRPLTVLKGKIGAQVDLQIAHISLSFGGMTSSATAEGLDLGAEYGVNDKLAVGFTYAFALHDFEIKGPLELYGAYQLMHSDKLDVGASVDLAINLNGTDPMSGDSTTDLALDAGLAIRYKIAPKFAIFTGSPFAPGPLGQHLHLGLNHDQPKTFDIPVGVGLQATPELFVYADTTIATILLSDPGMGDRVSTIGDFTPLTIGAWFNVNKNIDAVATVTFPDVQHAGDAYLITLGARYYN